MYSWYLSFKIWLDSHKQTPKMRWDELGQDCEQSLFFFRFSQGSAWLREGRAAKPRDETRETREEAREEKRETALASQHQIRLADAWRVDNKLSTIKPIDMLIMAEAPQECLSRFSKIETLGTEQREALEGLISPSMWRDPNLNAQSLSSLTRNTLVPKLQSCSRNLWQKVE